MLQKWKNRPPRSNWGEFGVGLPILGPCFFKLGVHLSVIWCFTKIAEWLEAKNRCRFFMKAQPLFLTGAVSSLANPVGTE
tara:strand:+ start:44743 stop:44982 length:240 start_codon:yes stop_codon:yes gene_type:complete